MWSGTQGRTGDRLLPKQVRYQAAPLPVTLAAYWPSAAAGCCLLLALTHSLGGPADRLDVAVVEIGELGAVVEQHPVAQPVEAVGQQHLALGALRHADQVDRGPDAVADAEVELVLVGRGQRVRLP